MNYLAIDASTEACSVALCYQEKVFSEFDVCPQSHSVMLLPMVDSVLKQANVSLSDVDALFFAQGPGSFTGVRIGVGVAQGLAFSVNLPLVGISTMQAMAQQAYEEKQQTEVIVAIDARMGEVYTGYYKLNEQNIMQAQNGEHVIPPELVAKHYEEFNIPTYGVGTGWQAYHEQLFSLITNHENIEIIYPNAQFMLKIGADDVSKGAVVSAENAQPVYVRDTVSWKKLPGRE